MPLRDHFHAPLYPTHSWESFHTRWANTLADGLDRVLPERFFTEVQIHLGSRIEADVAEFETNPPETGNGAAGGVGVQTWAPPAATQTVALAFPDDLEVRVFDLGRGEKRLVAVIELVSPSNKDRDEERRAFAAKCLAYLQRGVGLIVVDVVTHRRGNLHNGVLELLGQTGGALLAPEINLYAVAYRPARRNETNELDLWPVPLVLGQPLPLLPLALLGSFFVPVDLEATYTETCRRSKL